MITGAIVTKILAYIGAYVVMNKVAVPAAEFTGKKIGEGIGIIANKLGHKKETPAQE
jgi:hypothetical protein